MEATKDGLPIKLLAGPEDWRSWLDLHHADTKGVWLRFYKKGKGTSITYAEALDESLCYGWVDSQVARYDEDSYMQKFTPRRPKSIWSKRNTQYVERLIEAGRMLPAGLKEVEAARADGRWERAYESPASMEVPSYFLEELVKYPSAQEFFSTLNRTNRYAIAWRLQTAKTEVTRQRRMQAIIKMLLEQKKLH